MRGGGSCVVQVLQEWVQWYRTVCLCLTGSLLRLVLANISVNLTRLNCSTCHCPPLETYSGGAQSFRLGALTGRMWVPFACLH
jgi:hypothetical protein